MINKGYQFMRGELTQNVGINSTAFGYEMVNVQTLTYRTFNGSEKSVRKYTTRTIHAKQMKAFYRASNNRINIINSHPVSDHFVMNFLKKD